MNVSRRRGLPDNLGCAALCKCANSRCREKLSRGIYSAATRRLLAALSVYLHCLRGAPTFPSVRCSEGAAAGRSSSG